MERCFAMKEGKCVALTCACPGFDQCGFYKTRREYEDGQKASLRRIAGLPVDMQQYISKTFHQGEMPWAPEGE